MAKVVVDYQARQQFRGLSRQEQGELRRLLADPGATELASPTGSGGFVSKFGPDLRVLWRKQDANTVNVRSIVRHLAQEA